MAKIVLCDPVGEPNAAKKPSVTLSWSPEGRIGTLFNNHVSSHRVWKRVESLMGARFPGAAVNAFDKQNTFVQAPEATLEQVARSADVALVGVGA